MKTCEILTVKFIQLISSNKLKGLSPSKFYKTIVKVSFIRAICSCAHNTNLHPCYRFITVLHKNSTLFQLIRAKHFSCLLQRQKPIQLLTHVRVHSLGQRDRKPFKTHNRMKIPFAIFAEITGSLVLQNCKLDFFA